MADDPRTHSRSRPVADLPEALLAQADDLATRWAIALIRARPLEGIGDIAFEHLAHEAPALCEQALRALQSDVELDRLTGAGAASSRADSAPARQLAVIAGAADPAAAVVAVEALRGVLWEALLDQLHDPSVRQIGDIADRLACVCAAILLATVEVLGAAVAGAGLASAAQVVEIRDDHDAGVDPPASTSTARAERYQARVPSPGHPVVSPGRPVPSPGHPVVIVDERAGAPPSIPEIEIRDVRDVRDVRVGQGEQGPAAWISSIGARLEQLERDGLPFAVLLVELMGIERLREEELPEEFLALAGRMEQALASELGSSLGSLTRERPGRCWLLVAETDHDRAQALAERLVRAVASRASNRGASLEVAIGVAVCPEDGREAAMLAAHADVGLYAARAAVRASAGERATRRSGA